MSNILFRGSTGRVEGRLPREVCAFLAPLLQEGLVKAHAEAVCDLPGLGKFAEVPLMLSIEIEEGLFALEPEEELYRNAYCLLQFAHTGHIEQEQPKSQQAVAAAAEKGKADDHQQAEKTLAKEERNEMEEEQEEEEEVREEDVKELYDDETQLCEMPEARDPRLFVDGLALRRYQRQALAWMIQREKKRYVTEEDCTGLSSVTAAAAAADAGEGAVEEESGGGGVAIRDGRVRVASWGGASSNTKQGGSGDCGGGPGVAMHPLWERRAAASIVVRKEASGDCLDLFGGSGMGDDDDDSNAGGGGDNRAPQLVLSQPEAFFVNVYSRRFQREFPPASLGCRGGILADEMGMGKTVMLLSLILSDKERRQEGGGGSNGVGDGGEQEDDEKGQEEGGGPAAVGRDGSLVVCLDDDDDDDDDDSANAAEHVSKGKQKLGSGGPGGRNAATSSPEDALANADLPSRGKRRSPAVTEAVPSSAGSVAAGMKRRRAAAAAVRLDESNGGGKRVARGRGVGKGGGTLVVCPLSLIGQWRGELESKTRKGAISVGFHYGAGRSRRVWAGTRKRRWLGIGPRSTRELCRKDVVLTTYGVLSSEMAKHEADATARESTAPATTGGGGGGGGSAAPAGGLLGVRWSRVILDEAHSIRNTNTEQSRACLRLEADQRWAVTGTPIQNSLDDMAALLAFLRHEPWSDRGWWRKVISDPYKDGDAEALRRLKTVLAPILLRRTKSTLDSRGRPIVELPPKTVEIVRLQLSAEEREFYEALKKRSKTCTPPFFFELRSTCTTSFATTIAAEMCCGNGS
ncbi:DNA repair helicase rad5,16, putative [Ectocarpus siliculosus]|uniref:DNA repair helicase rad5,16, putative n=1 Tax=Ectocarpus siliculosus TaxID=2880 RepID=D7FJC4_ECTSI|nr:DNA repair helicase rad5,16, putative [Ectocarpus siliculosus]|eukprot:CBJ29027.1 DNA repair helicase rad5,16, putative [Ectocarpus siliculosus]